MGAPHDPSQYPGQPCPWCGGRAFWLQMRTEIERSWNIYPAFTCEHCHPPEEERRVAERFVVPDEPDPPYADIPAWDTIPHPEPDTGRVGQRRAIVGDSGDVSRTPPNALSPRVIDRSRLPGGRIMAGMVYVGRGSASAFGQHPWGDPCRPKAGGEEERRALLAEREKYIKERLARETGWLRPLAGRSLVYYGKPDWAELLLKYANDGRYDVAPSA